MRTLLIGDALAAARVLLGVGVADREAVLDRLLDEAHAAHLHAKRLGRPHPKWGNGSLMARSCGAPHCREPMWSDAAYLQCLALVMTRLAERAARRPVRARRLSAMSRPC